MQHIRDVSYNSIFYMKRNKPKNKRKGNVFIAYPIYDLLYVHHPHVIHCQN